MGEKTHSVVSVPQGVCEQFTCAWLRASLLYKVSIVGYEYLVYMFVFMYVNAVLFPQYLPFMLYEYAVYDIPDDMYMLTTIFVA